MTTNTEIRKYKRKNQMKKKEIRNQKKVTGKEGQENEQKRTKKEGRKDV